MSNPPCFAPPPARGKRLVLFHFLKVRYQFRIGSAKVLRNGAHFVEYSHEGGIAVPARHEMEMQMLAYAGAGGLSLIQAHIYAFAVEMLFEDDGTFLDEFDGLVQFALLKSGHLHHMPVWADHDVAVAIGEFVHNDEGVLGSVKDEAFGVLICVGRQTEDARIRLWAEYVVNTPRRPKMFHDERQYTKTKKWASIRLPTIRSLLKKRLS